MTMRKPKLKTKVSEGEFYLDELGDNGTWIPKSELINYIKDTYLTSPKSYYDALMHKKGFVNFDKCEVCGSPTKWINVFQGYSRTCSVSCRNKLNSMGNPDLIAVTRNGKITHVLNQDILTKYKVPLEIQRNLPTNITLEEFINFLYESGCLWISGYNHRSIRYAGSVKDLILSK